MSLFASFFISNTSFSILLKIDSRSFNINHTTDFIHTIIYKV